MISNRTVAGALSAVVALSLAACDSESTTAPTDPAFVQIKLTGGQGAAFGAASSAPAALGDEVGEPGDTIESAEVRISRVYLQGGDATSEEHPGRLDLFYDPEDPLVIELTDLRDGQEVALTGVEEVPEGRYGQLRLVVEDATVTLAGDLTFPDGEQTRALFVPSGQQAGIRVNLGAAGPEDDGDNGENGDNDDNGENGSNGDNGGNGEGDEASGDLEAESGTTTVVLVGFAVEENFVIQSNPVHGIMDVLFTPVLREVAREVNNN